MLDAIQMVTWFEYGKGQIYWALYFSLICGLSIFGLHRLYIILLYFKTKHKSPIPSGRFKILPSVTIQLPIYNEIYVIERLVEAVLSIDYPEELMEIQILDDSTDGTSDSCRKLVEAYKEKGRHIIHIHRKERTGFKAGALENGLKHAKGEFIAIFDSDFIPQPDFLLNTIHHFSHPEVGMVQARWGHTNRSYHLLTEVQAMLLDGHFILEHAARNRSGRFFNFNGTAGIWRKSCIEDAGGWHYDTLTEDVDLSYRAQLKGWHFIFLPEVVVPGELPVEMNSFKTQQHRWVKGGIQTARKILPLVQKSEQPLRVKVEACFHLLSNFAYVMVFFLSLLMPLSIFFSKGKEPDLFWIANAAVFLLTTISVGFFYLLAYQETTKRWYKGILYLPALFSIGLAMCINNSKAVFEALCGKNCEFKRTPKFNISSCKDRSWLSKKYKGTANPSTILELGLGIYFSFSVFLAFQKGMYSCIPFMVLFQMGFLYVSLMSIFQTVLLKVTFIAQEKLKTAGTLG